MTTPSRRQALKALSSASVGVGLTWTASDVAAVHRQLADARQRAPDPAVPLTPRFFTAHELATVTALANAILPADERSGNAEAAGVPAFIDFMMVDQPERQVAMRGGLAWIDDQCQDRFGRRFVDCDGAERGQLLDDLAWPARAPARLSHGVAFFTRFRDLTATGFWTSPMGIADLDYRGNEYRPRWDGCPPEVLARLGVSYDAD